MSLLLKSPCQLTTTASRKRLVCLAVSRPPPRPTYGEPLSHTGLNGFGFQRILQQQPLTQQPLSQPLPVAPAPLPAPAAPAHDHYECSETYSAVVHKGAAKAALPPLKTFVMGMMAGAYISFGAFLALTVAASMPGLSASNPGLVKLIVGLIFPVGLAMVTLAGAELYTGNTAVLPTAVYEGKATWGQVAKNWSMSLLGNLVGSLLMVAAIASTGMLTGNSAAISIAKYKTSYPFLQTLVKAILCNWLVCVAVWQSTGAPTVGAKLAALWPPITAFVTIGLEHSVANFFFIPMGIAAGADVTWMDFVVKNMIPVVLGNTIAGALIMAPAYSFFYGALGGSTKYKAMVPKAA